MNAKFEFTGEVNEAGLKRIRALRDIGTDVHAGDLGGWIRGENTLSPSGDAWVFGDAQVSGDARVSDNAQVSGDARVSDNARVGGNAWVSGDARVGGNAWVSGDARVFGPAW